MGAFFRNRWGIRMGRRRRIVGVALAVVVVAALAASVLLRDRPGRRRPNTSNSLANPPGMVDRLVAVDSPLAWAGGTFAGVRLLGNSPARVLLAAGPGEEYPRSGAWTSPVIEADVDFTELLPSWNAEVPPETGLRAEVRVRHTGLWRRVDWSPWLTVGSWGRTPPVKARRGRDPYSYDHGVVHVDYLALNRPADAFQLRVRLFSFAADDTSLSPALRRLTACYSGVVTDPGRRAALSLPPLFAGRWDRDLPVPFRTQKDAPRPLRGEICSPTSVSMVLAYWGVDRPTVEHALAIYDPEHGIFGNWGRAVQRAGELGLDAWLTRFRDWGAVRAEVARGRPVIASIRFGPGEFPSAVLPETDGHLIVVRGFTPAGDVIVNDPASRERGEGAVYKADELARAWFGRGGVGYVLSGPPRPGLVAPERVGGQTDVAAGSGSSLHPAK